MSCPLCGHENRDGARFCESCGARLGDGTPRSRCATASPAGRTFDEARGGDLSTSVEPRDARAYTPRHLVEWILTTRSALEGERKQVTVLFVDVVESMRLAEILGAEAWHGVLDRVFEILARAIHGFEGTINQFTGDGIMALFGAPIAHEDHARRACHAALVAMEELRAHAGALRDRGLELSLRMGLNSGEVVVGKIGDDLRMDYTAQGHSVGLAARMEQLAAPGSVLVTQHAARLIEGFFALADLGTRTMKGASAAVRVFELQGIGPLRTRLDASGLRGLSRLIGREAELAWLESILSRSLEANGQVVGVVGDAAVGKSRLCLEFVTRCRSRGIAVYEVHCPAHGATVPWLAVRDVLRSCFTVSPGHEIEDIRRSVTQQLLDLDPGWRGAAPIVLDALGITDPAPPDRSPHDVGTALGEVMRRFVRLRSAKKPFVLLLDDAHWIDRASDEIVRDIVASVRGARTLLLANFRPDYRPQWIGGSHYHQLALAPLGEASTRELLRDLLGSDDSLGDLLDRVRERTEGNPFFTGEVVQALATSGRLVRGRGAYRLVAPIDTLALPDTVQSLLAARIDRLDDRVKRVLQAAPVIGKQFDEPLLREISGLDDRELERALDELQEGEYLRVVTVAPRPEYAFKHPLMRDVAYHSQLGERRTRLHAAAAAALETLRAERLGRHAALIAHHWEAAGMRFEAARWKRRAALKVASIKVKGRGRRPRPE